jgi:hypothetical protein
VQGKYSFWIKLLFCLSAVLAITSYLVPATDGGEGWIPLLSGYADLTAFNGNLLLRGILGGVFNVLTVLSLLVINTKSVNNVFNPNLTVAFFLIILLLDPGAAYFNSLHPALLLFVWGQYCFISNRKFLSMFLLSSSALFYAPLILVLPLVLVISIIGASDMLRVAVKSLGGLLLPFLYVLSFRYMAFGDATVFIEEYINHSLNFSSPLQTLSFPSIFQGLCIIAITLHSVSYSFARLYSNSIITEHVLKMELMCLILGGGLFFLFLGNGEVPVNMIVALPASMLFSHYFTGNITAAPARIELILLCSAAVICRLYHFI